MATFELTVTYVDAPQSISSSDELIAKLGVKITNMPKETEHWDCKFTFGNHTESITYKFPDTKTISGNIWSAWLTNSTSGKLTVTVSYFNFKKLIKAESQSTVVTIPSWLKPFIHYVGASPHAYVVNEGFGYLQGKTKASLEISGYGAGGSKITSISIKNTAIGWNQVYKIDTSESFPDKTFVSPPLSRAGKNKFEIKVTDTRGRSATYTKEITVKSYAPPTIPTFTAERYNASGGKDSAGTYAKAYAEFWYTNVYDGTDDLNSVTAKLYYTDRNGQRDFIYIDSHTWSNLFGGGFTIDNSHTITLVVTDVVGGETRKDFEIMGTTYLLDFLPGGNGVGIGCEATTSGRLDVGFNTLFKGQNNIFSKSVKIGETGGVTLSNSGDTLKTGGAIYVPNNKAYYCDSANGSGWVHAISVGDNNEARVFTWYKGGALKIGHADTPETVISGKFVQLISGNSGLAIRFNNTALHPDDNGKVHCGWSSQRWLNGYYSGTLYAGNGTINTSDRKAKNDISDIDINFAKDFIMDLKPKTYKFKKDGESHEGKRLKMGFIAQDTHETGLKVKKDLALYQAHIVDKNGELSYYDDSMEGIKDENLEWGLDYSQIHAPHVRLTQDHENRISDHEIRISKLEETVAKQEDIIKQQAEIIKLLQAQLGMTNSESE